MARAEVELEARHGCVAQGQWQASVCAHPLVDGMRLAQRALRGRDAVGDAPVALAKTPQLAADLLRAKMPAQARLPSSSLRWTQAACSLPIGQWGPNTPLLALKEFSWLLEQGMAWDLPSAYICTALTEHLCAINSLRHHYPNFTVGKPRLRQVRSPAEDDTLKGSLVTNPDL